MRTKNEILILKTLAAAGILLFICCVVGFNNLAKEQKQGHAEQIHDVVYYPQIDYRWHHDAYEDARLKQTEEREQDIAIYGAEGGNFGK